MIRIHDRVRNSNEEKISNVMKSDDTDKDKLIEQLQSEDEYLRQELSKANQTITEDRQALSEMQQRHDEAQRQSNMIVMQLTKQLEQQTLLLEDMRGKSLWKRFKAALGFASS